MIPLKILNIPIFGGTIKEAVEELIDKSGEMKNRLISATGAHGIIEAHKRKEFKLILENFYLNLPDGMPNVWIGRWKGAKKIQRCKGPDFFKELMVATSDKNAIRHFFCGGMEGVAEELREACLRKWGNKHIAGVFCPPFLPVSKYDYPSIARIIKESGATIVWIGLSTPKQEEFATYLSKHTQVDFIICVGAAFDFHTDRVQQAPSWMQKSSLEWLFRLMVEPKRLYRRYVEIVPKFIYLNVLDFLGLYKNN